MTDAASKAALERAVSDLWEHHIQDKSPFEGHAAIVRAITAAQQAERTALAEYIKANGLAARTAQAELRAERERAGKLVEAASKAVKADAKREWGGDPEMQYLAECLDAYEVQP